MSNQNMMNLLKRQEEQRKDLAAGVYEAWQEIRQAEARVVSLLGAPDNIPTVLKEKLAKTRESFFEEWGSEGRLAALMAERHAKEREDVIKQENQTWNRNRQHDRGR